MNQPTIRNAAINDAEDIYLVEKSAFPAERQASYKTLVGRINLFPDGCYVFMADNKIVAFSTALIIDKVDSISKLDLPDQALHNPGGDTYEIRSIVVMKEYQRQGIGRKLMNKQVETARLLNKKYTQFTAAKDVSEFYEKIGFKMISDYEKFHNSKQALWEMKLK